MKSWESFPDGVIPARSHSSLSSLGNKSPNNFQCNILSQKKKGEIYRVWFDVFELLTELQLQKCPKSVLENSFNLHLTVWFHFQ